MVNALIKLNEESNRVINIVKAKYGLKDKSETINLMAREYENSLLEPQLRPEFIEKMKKREIEPAIKVKDFKKHFGLN